MIGSLKLAEGRLAAKALPGRDWTKRILVACEQYNDTVHSGTGLRPNQVTPENANQVFRRLFKPFAALWDLREDPLRLGTPVRLRLTSRGTFAKANLQRNTTEVYTVGRVRLHPRAGIKYKLFTHPGNNPIAGTYDRSEIVPIKLPQE